MSDATTRVLLADDHALLLDGLRRMIERVEGFEVVATVETGRAAVDAVRDFEPDVVLLDLALPELNGIDACEKIKSRHPDVAVMILSGYSQEDYVLDALRVGALGYVLKSASSQELERALRAAARGKRYLSPEVSGAVVDGFLGKDRQKPMRERLTLRQREIVQLICEGCTTPQIAERLSIAAKTVETHRTNLMKVMGVRDVVNLVKVAYKEGLVVEDDVSGGPNLTARTPG